MKFLFAAGDVGGARAVLPVARAAAQGGHSVAALAHGVFRAEGAEDWTWLDKAAAAAAPVDVMIYATSVADWQAFDLAEVARARGIPVLHVLDNWSSYGARLHGQDGRALIPDIYAVMDGLARHEALAEGVPEGILAVTGHPNLAGLAEEAVTLGGPQGNRLFFVSEPARIDSGPAADPGSRGYDEDVVSQALVVALAAEDTPNMELHIAPHPREDRDAVAARWARLTERYPTPRGPLPWALVPPDGVRAALHGARYVAGMSSILLYEAWLLGRPVASLQPGLQGAGLRTLSYREGLLFCDKAEALPATVAELLHAQPGQPKADLDHHVQAAQAILGLACGLAGAWGGGR